MPACSAIRKRPRDGFEALYRVGNRFNNALACPNWYRVYTYMA
jgi:hypothetical protein